MTPSVDIYALGGTIAMTQSKAGGVVPSLTGEAILEAVPELGDIAHVRVKTLAMVPSANLDFSTIRETAQRVRKSDAAAIVIMQGTDTIEETAFLFHLIYDGMIPVIFTGAMRSPNQASHDGPANLLAAVRAGLAAESGVYVVMDDTIHYPERVVKTHTFALSSFKSTRGHAGYVAEGEVVWENRRYAQETPAGWFAPVTAMAPVLVVKALGLGDDTVLNALDNTRFDGLVIEAFGAGHLPVDLARRVKELAGSLPVVLTSQASAGPALRKTYGYEGAEIDLLKNGLLSGGRLDAKKARILLSLALGFENKDTVEFFERSVKLL